MTNLGLQEHRIESKLDKWRTERMTWLLVYGAECVIASHRELASSPPRVVHAAVGLAMGMRPIWRALPAEECSGECCLHPTML